ncbi:hypothetical protein GP486_002827 [Trichoglossum hirsutum]|uniref:Uncharacterized protein n=1 Tax=Trichoglossum hirsutum TaxID=265104 RepID=A0A9P8LE75_9PEZI|nr:hypothetical protein GP486_002827 [Trichoglossum hirsutum]
MMGSAPQGYGGGYGTQPQGGKNYPQPYFGGTYELVHSRPAPLYGVAPSLGQSNGHAPRKVHGGGFVMGQRQGGSVPAQPTGGGLSLGQAQAGYAPTFGPAATYVPSQAKGGHAPKAAHGGGFVMGQGQEGHTQPGADRNGHFRAATTAAGSVRKGPNEDSYLSPWDAHLSKLVVQSTDHIYEGAQNSTWRRTFIRDISPWYMKIANYPFATVPANKDIWTPDEWGVVFAKWIPACCGLLLVLSLNPTAASGQVRNHGFYDPFVYKDWGCPRIARNPFEGRTLTLTTSSVAERVLGPRYLNFLNADSGFATAPADKTRVGTAYVFVGYTAEQFNHDSIDEMTQLHVMAETAARAAGVPAFWIAASCMPNPRELEQDVYRISDVMRGAHSLVIIVGPTASNPNPQTTNDMLKVWGQRMWTLPEALLSPQERPIRVYTRGLEGPPWEIMKKQFAAVVWEDPLISRQLIDHYTHSLDLSRLELVTIALRCLKDRRTEQYLRGDLSYALMGLLRQRPKVDHTDTAFRAFARLSLANDSDMLLERLVCTLPKSRDSPWLSMDDAWDTNLWDIYPRCQVAGIGDDDSVILDGAFGAAIRWKSFAPVAYIKRDSWKRFFARTLLHGSPFSFVIGVAIIVMEVTFLIPLAAIFLVQSLLVILASPYLVRVIYSGKLWGQQAWFFGFEGHLDLATIESYIFGSYMGRLKWSTSGSPISKHVQNQFDELVGIDPTTDPAVRARVDAAATAPFGSMKVFTLIDTNTLTVTMFEAVRPPVAVLLCGREGGMQRAVMCSYDWKTQTLYRETVLRMETPVLQKMFRVHRFRFGFSRPMEGTAN